MVDSISIRGARLHNLKNVSLDIPKNNLVVLTGVSGSGKSTLGFDILYKEGQRQYMESLGMVEWGVSRPPVDSISGLSPTISIDQRITNRSPRSTVGTITDVYTYLRILFARLGHRPCPACGKEVAPSFDPSSLEGESALRLEDDNLLPATSFPCTFCGEPVPEIGMAHFSFNKPEGACPTCTGLGRVHQVNLKLVVNEHKSILDGAIADWIPFHISYYGSILRAAAKHYHFDFDLSLSIREYTPFQRDLLFFGVNGPQFRRHFPDIKPPNTVREGRFEGIATNILRRYTEHIQNHVNEEDYRDRLEDALITQICPDCAGTRLRSESRKVTLNAQNIVALSHLSLSDLGAWLSNLTAVMNPQEKIIGDPVLVELHERIDRLREVGAGYLSLDQDSISLSTGEMQRLRLASLLGSGLCGVLYILDEPTIGLHQRDTRNLIDTLRRLRDFGNTVLVIEHDLEVIAAADYVVDFGPGGGKNGGRVVAAGTPKEITLAGDSLTGDYLAKRKMIVTAGSQRRTSEKAITVHGAREHNLKNITVRLPLGLLIAVTGVSGSGKSSLIFDILDRAIRHKLRMPCDLPGEYDSIEGYDDFDKIISIDQNQIGRIPRSNTATYTEIFTPIRQTFASTAEARQLGFSARYFSFNSPGGRCERCEGMGTLNIKMNFLPDVEVRCSACLGRRFKQEVLKVHYRNNTISQVLDLTAKEAMALFADVPAVASRLKVLCDVGLGYLQLGQPATTLSGGEAQRVKLAKELGRRTTGRTLYLFDEPTIGLHLSDVDRLLDVLQRLVNAGNTVIVIEHNLELIKTADWVIDLGPEGGEAGGELVAEGTPEQIASVPESRTGRYLKGMLKLSNAQALYSDNDTSL